MREEFIYHPEQPVQEPVDPFVGITDNGLKLLLSVAHARYLQESNTPPLHASSLHEQAATDLVATIPEEQRQPGEKVNRRVVARNIDQQVRRQKIIALRAIPGKNNVGYDRDGYLCFLTLLYAQQVLVPDVSARTEKTAFVHMAEHAKTLLGEHQLANNIKLPVSNLAKPGEQTLQGKQQVRQVIDVEPAERALLAQWDQESLLTKIGTMKIELAYEFRQKEQPPGALIEAARLINSYTLGRLKHRTPRRDERGHEDESIGRARYTLRVLLHIMRNLEERGIVKSDMNVLDLVTLIEGNLRTQTPRSKDWKAFGQELRKREGEEKLQKAY